MNENDEEQFKWVQKGDIIFKPGENPAEYAYFGWQTSLGEMYFGYIIGYKNSADTLIDYSLSMLGQGRIDIGDTYVFPICFMYRQLMELSLKVLYILFSADDDSTKEKTIRKSSHNLIKMWTFVKPIIEMYSLEQEKNDIEIVEAYINEMHSYQETSFEFRYPTHKDGSSIHNDWEYLDLVNLKDKMERFYNYIMAVWQCLAERINKS